MFEIKITNKYRERIHTVNLGTEIEEELYFKIGKFINEYIDGSNVPKLE